MKSSINIYNPRNNIPFRIYILIIGEVKTKKQVDKRRRKIMDDIKKSGKPEEKKIVILQKD